MAGLLACRQSIPSNRQSILSCRHSIQDRKYRSKGLLGAYFGIRTPPAGLAQAAFTEVLACLPATSVFLSSRHSIQDRDYRSNRVFALYFRNLI